MLALQCYLCFHYYRSTVNKFIVQARNQGEWGVRVVRTTPPPHTSTWSVFICIITHVTMANILVLGSIILEV